MLPHFADCWHPGDCARCPWRAQHPPFPSTEEPRSCNLVLPRNYPPAQVAGTYTEKRYYGELLNQDGEPEDLYSLLGNLFSDSIKRSSQSHREWLKGGIKGFGGSDTSCGLDQTLWCSTGETFWIIKIFCFILLEHQRDWNRSWTHCAHGKAPLWTTDLQYLLNMRTQPLPSRSAVVLEFSEPAISDWGNPSTLWVFLPIFLPSVHRVPQYQTWALQEETSDQRFQPFRLPKDLSAGQRNCTYSDLYGIKDSSRCLCHLYKPRSDRLENLCNGEVVWQQLRSMGICGGKGRNQTKLLPKGKNLNQ